MTEYLPENCHLTYLDDGSGVLEQAIQIVREEGDNIESQLRERSTANDVALNMQLERGIPLTPATFIVKCAACPQRPGCAVIAAAKK